MPTGRQAKSQYLKSLRIPDGISEQDRNFLYTALGVPVDELLVPTGIPDKDTTKSNVRVLRQELDVDLGAFNGGGAVPTVSMDVVVWPWERQAKMQEADISQETRLSTAVNTINTGGVGIYITDATTGASSVFPTPGNKSILQPLNHDTNGVAGQVLCMPDTFYNNDRMRVVGSYTELIYTSSKVAAAGSVLGYEIDQTVQDAEYYLFTGAAAGVEASGILGPGGITGAVLVPDSRLHKKYPMPLGSAADARVLPTTVDIDGVELGWFMPDNYEHTDNEASYPIMRNIIIDGVNVLAASTTTALEGNNNITLPNVRKGFMAGQLVAADNAIAASPPADCSFLLNPRNYYSNRTLKGVRYDNLNTSTGTAALAPFKCKIIRCMIIEAFSDATNPITSSNMKASPPYNPIALAAYELLSSVVPVFMPVSMNDRRGYVTKLRSDMNLVLSHLTKKHYTPLPARTVGQQQTIVKTVGGKGGSKSSTTTTTTKPLPPAKPAKAKLPRTKGTNNNKARREF